MPGIADADPVAVALTWLREHPRMTEVLGGPAAEHISGLLEAPWPHVVVEDGVGGSLRDAVWTMAPELLVKVYGHPAGMHGKAALRYIALVALECLLELPEREHSPTDPVVSEVAPSGVPGWQPLTSGQGVYEQGCSIVLHPPLAAASP